MIKSMTAYSRASISSPLGRLVIEIHSVNRKMLDMSLYLPKESLAFDIEVRKWLSKSLERGQVTLRLTLQSEGSGRQALFQLCYPSSKTSKRDGKRLRPNSITTLAKRSTCAFLVSQLQMQRRCRDRKKTRRRIKAVLKEAVEKALRRFDADERDGRGGPCPRHPKTAKIIEENIAAIESKKESLLSTIKKNSLERLKEIGQLHGGDGREDRPRSRSSWQKRWTSRKSSSA